MITLREVLAGDGNNFYEISPDLAHSQALISK